MRGSVCERGCERERECVSVGERERVGREREREGEKAIQKSIKK